MLTSKYLKGTVRVGLKMSNYHPYLLNAGLLQADALLIQDISAPGATCR